MIPYSRQEINSKDIKSVIEVLKSDFITQGKKVPEFENKVKKYLNRDNLFLTQTPQLFEYKTLYKKQLK